MGGNGQGEVFHINCKKNSATDTPGEACKEGKSPNGPEAYNQRQCTQLLVGGTRSAFGVKPGSGRAGVSRVRHLP